MDNSSQFKVVRDVIRNRKTTKVISIDADRLPLAPDVQVSGDRQLAECIETAGWAPFHYARNVDGIPEPWRFHVLAKAACSQLASEIGTLVEMKPSAKMPQLLRGCSALVLATWLPQNSDNISDLDAKKLRQVNEEHLAATAAAVQNLLLLCESLGWSSYWSSGRLLCEAPVFDRLGISFSEKLIAAVFVRYSQVSDQKVKAIYGKHRDSRTKPIAWSRTLGKLPDR